ncbi:hypothetical protein SS50377_21106 [Spironucleus salmonicida]|uniref:Uncharacterized protein n=1 Tax=Spironucleus salmonicida TaxID=348837 RepID=V6LHV6_9EUKA|nr:hypothetical protein SS50377_21106 [Spironucleus salmonicida]|eukprot:EST43888.1 Hypothetical protein SS50377_16188 [Spironucleus salmonicida]
MEDKCLRNQLIDRLSQSLAGTLSEVKLSNDSIFAMNYPIQQYQTTTQNISRNGKTRRFFSELNIKKYSDSNCIKINSSLLERNLQLEKTYKQQQLLKQDLVQENNCFKQQIQNLTENITKYEIERQNLIQFQNEQVEAMNEEHSFIQNQYIEEKLQQSQQKLNLSFVLEGENQTQADLLKAKEMEIQFLREKINRLSNQFLKNRIKKHQQYNQNLNNMQSQIDFEVIQQEKNNLKLENSQLQVEIQQLQKQNFALNSRLQSFQNLVNDHENRYKQIMNRLEQSVRIQYAYVNQEVQTFDNTNITLPISLKENDIQIEILASLAKDLQAAKLKNNTIVQNEFEILQNNEILIQQCNNQSQIIVTQNNEISQLKKQLFNQEFLYNPVKVDQTIQTYSIIQTDLGNSIVYNSIEEETSDDSSKSALEIQMTQGKLEQTQILQYEQRISLATNDFSVQVQIKDFKFQLLTKVSVLEQKLLDQQRIIDSQQSSLQQSAKYIDEDHDQKFQCETLIVQSPSAINLLELSNQ